MEIWLIIKQYSDPDLDIEKYYFSGTIQELKRVIKDKYNAYSFCDNNNTYFEIELDDFTLFCEQIKPISEDPEN